MKCLSYWCTDNNNEVTLLFLKMSFYVLKDHFVIRVAEKEKKKRRLAELRERGEDIGPNRKSLKKNTMKDSSCNLRVVIDCSFDSYMSDKVF